MNASLHFTLILFLGSGLLNAQAPPDDGIVAGIVTDPSGQPLPQATVTLMGEATPGRSPMSMQSDPQGHFQFEKVAPGGYRLTGQRAGYVRTQSWRTPGGGEAASLQVSTNRPVTGLRIVLIRAASVSGRVVDEFGDPRTALVSIIMKANRYGRTELRRMGSVRSDDHGEFLIADAPPGKYYVLVAPGEQAGTARTEMYLSTFLGNTTTLEQAATVDLDPGSPVEGLTIKLVKSAVTTVHGKMRDARLGQMVSLSPIGPLGDISGWTAQTQSDGSFVISAPPGDYHLAAGLRIGNDFRGWMDYRVDPADHRSIELALDPPFAMKARVVLEKESPNEDPQPPEFPAVRVTLTPPDFPFARVAARSNAKGEIEFPRLLRTKYRMDISGLPDGVYFAGVRPNPGADISDALDLTAGAPAAAVPVIVRDSPGALAGRVTADDKPYPAAVVTLLPEPERPDQSYFYRRVIADDHGQFTIPNLAPGDYVAYAWDDLPADGETDSEIQKRYRDQASPISIRKNSSSSVTLPLIHSGE
ncbi:MAG: carboxypeptidase regulatory-like domain-containing protein [Acidobacteriia bacterium]|nr:carboxypeptidase regulatory-like domain-containing protein [Terriglobia bacterium]